MSVNNRRTAMPERLFLSVGEAADEIGVKPRMISDLFYARQLSAERCPIVAGRRLIPRDYLPEIAAVLASSGSNKERR
jgi:hypothetical protein